jgi:hypothetical protein
MPPPKDFYENLSLGKKCVDALKERTFINDKVKTLVNDYLIKKTPASIDAVSRFISYNSFISAFGDNIKRLRQGHNQIIVLGFQESREEYPLDHAMAAKIMAPKAEKIIVINSENRHLEPNKTFKMLYEIFNLPFSDELK